MATIRSGSERPTLLVVDDQRDNLMLMTDLLSGSYRIKVAVDGETALKVARSIDPPDLILLDVMMPGMDGYEVCRRLKEDAATRSIPVIFLTARTDTEDERQGLELGAVDYITKPLSPPILLARVRNHLELKMLNDRLSALVVQRTRELEEANARLKTLDAGSQDFLRTIAHELRTPTHGLLGIAELALEEIRDEHLRGTYKTMFESSSQRMVAAIDAALQLAALKSGSATVATSPVEAAPVVEEVAAALRPSFAERDLSFIPPSPEGGSAVLGSRELLKQAVSSLLKAALRLALPGTSVAGRLRAEGGRRILAIAFQARELSDELRASIFDTFSYDRASSYVEDLGLTLPLAAELVRAMGGEVSLERSGSMAEFRLVLRAA